MTSHTQYYEENLHPLQDKILKTVNSLSSPFYLTGGTAETTIQLNGKEIPVRMKAILHCDRNWGIGKNDNLMFRLPKDMAFFRRTTKGKTVVMGKNTLLSLPGGKPLKDRTNIVLSSSLEKDGKSGFIVASNLEELKAVLSRIDNDGRERRRIFRRPRQKPFMGARRGRPSGKRRGLYHKILQIQKQAAKKTLREKLDQSFPHSIKLKDSFFFGHFYSLRHYKVRRNT